MVISTDIGRSKVDHHEVLDCKYGIIYSAATMLIMKIKVCDRLQQLMPNWSLIITICLHFEAFLFLFLKYKFNLCLSSFCKVSTVSSWFTPFIQTKNVAKIWQANSSITRWSLLNKLVKFETCLNIYFNDWSIIFPKRQLMLYDPVDMWNPMKTFRNIRLLQDVLHNVWNRCLIAA